MSKLGKLTLLSILSITGSLAANQPVDCQPTSYPDRVTIRHIEGKGVGYNTGYTTLEGFFTAPSLMDTAWVPFFDLRGHVLDDGKTAANAGLGVRYVGSSQVWGINSYYDFRHTTHRNYNQYGFGLECLGRVFDFRLNGYFPFGKKASSLYGAKFAYFEGHSLILSQKKTIAYTGGNAEVGVHAKVTDNINFYTGAGPYFLNHRSRSAWGGELRAAFDFTEYFRLEGNTSYDGIFKWIGQGQVSVNIPFGPRDKIKRKDSNSCDKQLMLRDRSLQRVDRDEIIVIEKRRTHTTAIDPATGLPFFFVFVNNTSHSSGTYESPYPTLTDAQNYSAPGNIILVSSGNGSAYSNQAIILQDNQKLWGEGLSYLLQTQQGSVLIPAFSSFPTITAASGAAVTLGNNCEVAGLNFSNFNIGIRGGASSSITNAYIHDNSFSGVTTTGILLENCQGNLQIINNQISGGGGSSLGISIVDNLNNVMCTITNNTINQGEYGINVLATGSSGQFNLYLANNTMTNTTQNGIFLNPSSSGTQGFCGTVENNSCSNCGSNGLQFVSSSSQANLDFLGNIFQGCRNSGMLAVVTAGNSACLSVVGNTSQNNGSGGYAFENSGGTLQVENFTNFSSYNVGTVTSMGVTSVPTGTCSCD